MEENMEERIAALEARVAELEAELAREHEDVITNRARIEANIDRLDKQKEAIKVHHNTLGALLEQMTEASMESHKATIQAYTDMAQINTRKD